MAFTATPGSGPYYVSAQVGNQITISSQVVGRPTVFQVVVTDNAYPNPGDATALVKLLNWAFSVKQGFEIN